MTFSTYNQNMQMPGLSKHIVYRHTRITVSPITDYVYVMWKYNVSDQLKHYLGSAR